MECMMAYGGNNLINMILSRVYATQRNKFKGSGSAAGARFAFDVTQVPVARLVPNTTSYNLEIDLPKVRLTGKAGPINFDKTIAMRARGKLAISQGRLSLTSITVDTTSTSGLDQIVVGLINSFVIPRITAALASIPIPQLHHVFDSSLSAEVRTGKVIAGPALEVGARITGQTGISAADSPSSSDISALNNGTATNARMLGLVSGGAVNVLIRNVLPPLSHGFDERASKAGFGAGIKGTVKASVPNLKITNGNAKASTTISFSGLKAGIKAPLIGWKWVSLSAPDTDVVVTNSLSASGNIGLVRLTGVSSISVNLHFPSVLDPVEHLLENLLNAILSLFRGIISNAVSGKTFELFTLPTTVPGTNLGATLSFDTGGLAYFKSSVRAMIRVRA
jgi:hypothetical protein